MCGICGFYGFKNKGLLKRMTDSIKHRGPDGEGYYSDKLASLGHRRLSIIDLSQRGKQPMSNEDGSIWITFNGEIYNFQEIKKDLLKKGHKFKSNADTEVIIHSYEEYGQDCLQKLNGMFAFCIYDSNKKELFLARDRFGIKPLYYYWDGKRFLFASEIKSILEFPIKKEVNNYAIIDYLTFQHSLDDKTFFKGIKILLPSHKLIVQKESIKITRYWDIDFSNKETFCKNKAIIKFKRLFHEAVKNHLMSDVGVGSYLSSGFDSSSVATIASKILPEKLETFTGAFKESPEYQYFNELNVAKKVAKKINALNYKKIITPQEFQQNFYKFIYHMDEPKNGSPGISQMLVSQLIKKHAKVVLTGHGGDEILAGYHHYKSYLFKSMIQKNILNIFKLPIFFKPNEILRSFYFLLITPFVEDSAKTGLFVHFTKNERKKLFTKSFYEKIKDYKPYYPIDYYFSHQKLSQLNKIQYIYLRTYLPSILITQDKVDMSNSVESRIPFLDQKLVEFAMSIRLKDKLYNNELKYIIKESMKKELPKEVYSCPKRGFPTPYALWFKKELKPFLYQLLLSESAKKRGIFNKSYIKKLLDKFCNSYYHGKMDMISVNKIWCLICIEGWFKVFIDQNKEDYN